MTIETDRAGAARPRGIGRIDPALRDAAASLDVNEFQAESLPAEREEASEETTPEDLLAGAHSASLAMAIGAALTDAHYPPVHVRVDADCKLDQVAFGDPRVGQMLLTVSAMVPGIDEDKFNRLVDSAVMSCPISQALRPSVEIAIHRKLE